jgi:hypothetical protein
MEPTFAVDAMHPYIGPNTSSIPDAAGRVSTTKSRTRSSDELTLMVVALKSSVEIATDTWGMFSMANDLRRKIPAIA